MCFNYQNWSRCWSVWSTACLFLMSLINLLKMEHAAAWAEFAKPAKSVCCEVAPVCRRRAIITYILSVPETSRSARRYCLLRQCAGGLSFLSFCVLIHFIAIAWVFTGEWKIKHLERKQSYPQNIILLTYLYFTSDPRTYNGFNYYL